MGKARKAGRKRKNPVTMDIGLWDHGATGQANRIGLVVERRGDIDPETGKELNPNGVTGARRYDLVEVWYRKGRISAAGFSAAEKLRNAYEQTRRGPSCLPDNDRVQSSPKPDKSIEILIDRVSSFSAMWKHVQKGDRALIWAVLIDRKTPAAVKGYAGPGYKKGMDHIRDALDRVAMSMGC